MDKQERGLKNWKNLFKKPSFQDWLILFMLIMVLFMTWAYQKDITSCREYYEENYNPKIIINEEIPTSFPDFVIGEINTINNKSGT